MGFFNLISMVRKRLAEKDIKYLEKVIDELNKVLEMSEEGEKAYLKDVAKEKALLEAKLYGGRCDSIYLDRKEMAQGMVNYYARMHSQILGELAVIESIKKRKIEELENGDFTKQKRRLSCFSI